MSALPNPEQTHDPSGSNEAYFDPDAVVPRNSPLIQPIRVNFRPSPTPSLELSSAATDKSPTSPPSDTGGEHGRKPPRNANRPNLGDAVLVSYLGNGERPDIAQAAGASALATGADEPPASVTSSEDDREPPGPGGPVEMLFGLGGPLVGNGERRKSAGSRSSMSIDLPDSTEDASPHGSGPPNALGSLQLQSLASTVLAFSSHRAEVNDNSRGAPSSLDIKREREVPRSPVPLSALSPAHRSPVLLGRTTAYGAVPESGRNLRQGHLRRNEEDTDRDHDMVRDEPLPSIFPIPQQSYSPGSNSVYSHSQSPLPSLSPMQSMSLRSPAAMSRGLGGPLPPINQTMASPRSDTSNGHERNPLPSIKDLDLQYNRPVAQIHTRSPPGFPQSPPGGLPRLGAISHGSPPPMSPNELFRTRIPTDIPSPALHSPYYSHHTQPLLSPHQANGFPPRHSIDYSSSSATETPGSTGTGAAASPGSAMSPGASGVPGHLVSPLEAPQHGQQLMLRNATSIDGLTTMGSYICNHPGCNALPFQTQYLLNSHANVHSSDRPHYCPVKDCPRSEGGKGFKRKNEMIRHGLVHESPGYVCPFCPDREHKYPRPDNLQRHVRVHHVDKDKDDPLLRDVLAQRPDGPSRGRRRRHGPG